MLHWSYWPNGKTWKSRGHRSYRPTRKYRPNRPQGIQGVPGVTGATGNTGPTGQAIESIIPFASGLPITLTTIAGGLIGTPAFVGFGSSAPGIAIVNDTINLTNPSATLTNFAFSVPRDGVITSIAAYFSTTLALSLVGSNVLISAQLFQSTAPNNNFTAIPGALVSLSPILTSILAVGTISSGIAQNLSIPVTAQTRLILVYTATASGLSLLNSVVGYASAGVGIA